MTVYKQVPTTCKCTVKNLVYTATVTGAMEKYVGLPANTFKKRYGGHKHDFGNPDGRTKTTPAVSTWKLKDKTEDPEID